MARKAFSLLLLARTKVSETSVDLESPPLSPRPNPSYTLGHSRYEFSSGSCDQHAQIVSCVQLTK